MEYLVTMTTYVPDGTPDQAADEVRAREAAHSRELAAAGHLVRLWRPPLRPGEWRSLGLFAAAAARSRALVSGGRAAEEEYREAIELLGRTRMATHLARARLVYGEWLRRKRRRSPSSPARGEPTRRSPPSCSSAAAPWSGTCTRCSPSWTSAPALSSTRP